MTFAQRMMSTSAPRAAAFVRCIVGAVFLSEGIQKFLFPVELGVGRFAHIGIPWPGVSAPFVGVCEIACGVLLVAGLFTRAAALVMIINMTVAICSTKIPMLLAKGFWPFAHESRVDFSMLCGCLMFLMIGAGGVSVDHLLERSPREKRPQ
ncbi:MAG TPA: DoxX family protein [Bacteroidota bacterium]|nr:DoxX family protein [Bacteroidota bacterium]